jgi:hypothetical protein
MFMHGSMAAEKLIMAFRYSFGIASEVCGSNHRIFLPKQFVYLFDIA